MNKWISINWITNKFKCDDERKDINTCYFICDQLYRETFINKALCLKSLHRSINCKWVWWYINKLEGIRINHRLSYLQLLCNKAFSDIPHLIIKTHFTVKLINWYIWDLLNQVRYNLHKSKMDQALLTNEESHFNALSFTELLK